MSEDDVRQVSANLLDASGKPGLTELSLRAIKWNYLGLVVRVLAQVAAQIALARMLGPESFGLFAAAFVVISIGSIVAEMGLGSALVQKKELTTVDVRFAFTWLMLAGILMGGITYLMAEPIAEFFEDGRIAAVLQGLAPVFFVQALGVVPLSLLRREMEFKTIQIVQTASYLAGYVMVGIGFAYWGAGVWSLVAAWTGQAALASALFLLAKRHAMAPRLRVADNVSRGFSIRVLLTNMSNWVIENVDNLIVGKAFGPTALGLYSVSYNLVRTPANHLVVTLQSVLFPASSRAQDNLEGLRRAYLTVVSGVALIAVPVFAGMAAVADTMTLALFGTQWQDAGDLLLPLALSMVLHSVMAVAGPVLWGKGAAGAELRVQFWIGLLFVAALLVATQFSIIALAWTVCAVYAMRMTGMTMALMHQIKLPARALWHALRGGLMAAALVIPTLMAGDVYLAAWDPVSRLALEILMAGIVWLAFIIGTPGHALSDELLTVAQKLLLRTPLSTLFLMRRIQASRTVAGPRS